MKIKKEHYNHICRAISEKITPEHMAEVKQSYKTQGLSDERRNWDIFHYCGLTDYACKELYQYLNDNHISTALRKIIA